MTMSHRKQAHTSADKILNAALERFDDEGLVLELSNIKMEDAIAASGVSRATAYRHWRTRQDFIADVLVAAVKRADLLPENSDDLTQILHLIASNESALFDPQIRRNVVVEGLRISLRSDIARVASSHQWRTMLSLSALHPFLDDPKVRNEVGRALRETEARFDAHRVGVYRGLTKLLGYRIIPLTTSEEAGLAELATAAGTMMRGIVLRGLPDPDWLNKREEATLFGSTVRAAWSMPERLLAQTLLSRLEPDPDLVWSKELVRQHVENARAAIQRLYEANEESAPSLHEEDLSSPRQHGRTQSTFE